MNRLFFFRVWWESIELQIQSDFCLIFSGKVDFVSYNSEIVVRLYLQVIVHSDNYKRPFVLVSHCINFSKLAHKPYRQR